MKNTLLIIAGVHSLLFAAFHLCFWRLFAWQTELSRVSAINRGVMQVLNLCLTYFFIAIGLITVADRAELLGTRLGHHLLLLLSVFWVIRLVEQFLFFDGKTWRSIVLSAIFLAGAVIYAVPLLMT
jgi:hypothetical protein